METTAKSNRNKALDEKAVDMLYEHFHAIKTPRDAEVANAPKYHPVLVQDVSTTFFSDAGWSKKTARASFFIPADDGTTTLRWGYWATAQYLKDGTLQLIGYGNWSKSWSGYGANSGTLFHEEDKAAAMKFIKGSREIQAILKG